MKYKTEEIGSGLNMVSSFYKSFSGTDTLVFIMLPGSNPVVLGSITTLSYSIYRTKQPVINLGRTSINGLTRGSRIFAGSMVFTMINQHWLKELQDTEQLSWLKEYQELKADELPLFDVMLVSANEYGSSVDMFIFGLDITDEGQVVSVEDLFTENTLSFVARDIDSFTAMNLNPSTTKVTFKRYIASKIKLKGWDFMKGALEDGTPKRIRLSSKKVKKGKLNRNKREYVDISRQDIADYDRTITQPTINKKNKKEQAKKLQALKGFTRDLEYRPFNYMTGDDVTNVQLRLAKLNLPQYITNVYDINTYENVKKFQSQVGLKPYGIVDTKTYLALLSETNRQYENPIGIIINLSGAYIYNYPNDSSTIVDIKTYQSTIEILDKVAEDFQNQESLPISSLNKQYYKIQEGYINVNDVYSYEYSNKVNEFSTIKRYETGAHVLLLQQLINSIYPFTYQEGVYDENTERAVTRIQVDNNLACMVYGIVNDETWRFILTLTGNLQTQIINENVTITALNPQGTYNINSNEINTNLMQGFNVSINANKPLNIKAVVIAYYPNNGKKIKTQEYTITQTASNIQINFSDFQNMFNYSLEHNSIPNKIEYIVYPVGEEACKWVINYSI